MYCKAPRKVARRRSAYAKLPTLLFELTSSLKLRSTRRRDKMARQAKDAKKTKIDKIP